MGACNYSELQSRDLNGAVNCGSAAGACAILCALALGSLADPNCRGSAARFL